MEQTRHRMPAVSPAMVAGYGYTRLAGLIGGPLLAGTMLSLPVPDGLPPVGWAVAAVAAFMAVWWMTEAAPLAATALLPLIFFPLLGIAPLSVTAQSYAHPLVFLFLGGFLLARAMQRWRLTDHVALRLLRLGGTRPVAIVASFMVATAFLSMWVSNTATAMMMLPIGQSIVAAMRENSTRRQRKEVATFATVLMLGIGYAATIGGMGTLIGTPPNALFANFASVALGVRVGFLEWMLIGVPAVLVLLPLAWLVLTQIAFRVRLAPARGMDGVVAGQLAALGPLDRAQKLLAWLLAATALAWMGLPVLQAFAPELGLTDAGIALAAALALFIVRTNRSPDSVLLRWEDAQGIRWDILILFGGGIALAWAIGLSGLAAWIGQSVSALEVLPLALLILTGALIIALLGELASNTAIAATFLPVAGATAIGIGADPIMLTLPVALAASIGFMLPVATPPNAIVYGSGLIAMPQMLRAGILLDIVGVLVVTAVTMTVGMWVLGR